MIIIKNDYLKNLEQLDHLNENRAASPDLLTEGYVLTFIDLIDTIDLIDLDKIYYFFNMLKQLAADLKIDHYIDEIQASVLLKNSFFIEAFEIYKKLSGQSKATDPDFLSRITANRALSLFGSRQDVIPTVLKRWEDAKEKAKDLEVKSKIEKNIQMLYEM